MRFLGAMAATAAALALVLAACGSGSDRSEEGAPPTTAKQETIVATTTDSEPEPEPITAAEQRWLQHIERYGQRLDDEIALGGAVTHSTMRREARLYLGCARMLDRAGDPGRFEPARRLAERSCDRLKKAARFLEQAIASSERGGFVYAGSPDEDRFNHALQSATEAAANGQYDLQRALGQAEEIERTVAS